MSQETHILVIDDDRGTRETLSDVLRLRDYTVETAGNGQEGLNKLSTCPFDVAIVDIKLPDISGSDLLPLMKEVSPEIGVILITAYASLNSAIEAVHGDAFAYIIKPFEMEHLLFTLEKALEKRRLAIENRRLYQMAQQELAERKQAEEEIQRQRLAILHDINLAITSTLDLQAVLCNLLEKIHFFLPYPAATVRLLNRETGGIEPIECRNLDEKEWKAEKWRAGRGTPNLVFETKAPVEIRNVQSDPRVWDPEFFRKQGLVSYLGVPLVVKEEILGVLSFYTKEEHQFSKEEVEFLSTLAGEAAIAIKNARLSQETETQTRRLLGLSNVTRLITSSLDRQRAMDLIVKTVVDLLQVDMVHLWVVDKDGQALHLLASHGHENLAPMQVTRFSKGQGVVGAIWATGELAFIRDLNKEPRWLNTDFVKRTGFRSFAGLPLTVEGRVVGVISAFSRRLRSFGPEEHELITLFAGQAAIAIHNSHLYEQEERRARELSALQTVTAAASESLELDTVLQEVIKKITEIFHFDATRIFLLNAQGDEIELRAAFETKPEVMGFLEIKVLKLGEGVAGRVTQTGETMIFENIKADLPRYLDVAYLKDARRASFNFLAMFPIKTKKRTAGSIACLGENPRRLTPDEIRLITSMADQVGVAVENATLFQESVTRARELSALYSVATVVNQSLDINLVLRSVMRKVLEIFGFDAARIYLYEKDNKELRLLAHQGFPKDYIPHDIYKPGQGILGRVFERGEPILFEDIQTDPEFNRMVYKRVALRAGFRGSFGIPIKVKDRTLGVINFVSKEPHNFSPSENQLILSIANHVGIAVENARLYMQTKEQASQLEKDITERKQAEEQLKQANTELARSEKALRETIEDLKEAQLQLIQVEKLESVGRLAARVAHEVKNPLAVILQGIHYVSKHLPTNGDNVAMALQEMDNAVKRADSIIRGLLNFSAPSELSLTTVELNSVVEQSVLLMKHELDRYHVKVVRELSKCLPPLRIDKEKIEQVFVNIFMNAIHVMLEGGTLTVKTYAKRLTEVIHNAGSRKSDYFSIGQTVVMAEVEDTGTGIPKDKLAQIFDPFFTTKSTGKGTGLGLTVTKKIIDLHGGTIDIGNRRERGARVTIMFKAQGGNDHDSRIS